MEMFLPFSAACHATRDFPGRLRARLFQPAATTRERTLPARLPNTHLPQAQPLRASLSKLSSGDPRVPGFPSSSGTADINGQLHPVLPCWGEVGGQGVPKPGLLQGRAGGRERTSAVCIHYLFIPPAPFKTRIPGGYEAQSTHCMPDVGLGAWYTTTSEQWHTPSLH